MPMQPRDAVLFGVSTEMCARVRQCWWDGGNIRLEADLKPKSMCVTFEMSVRMRPLGW
jgi:hypothetical protein